MPGAIGFDIYGTLVDPLEMNEHLRPIVGEDLADGFSGLWREKQIEYTFRRALMRRYEDFGVCTRQALVHTANVLGVNLSEEEEEKLLEEYQNLRPFPDVIPGLEAMKAKGHTLVAFSNGVDSTPRTSKRSPRSSRKRHGTRPARRLRLRNPQAGPAQPRTLLPRSVIRERSDSSRPALRPPLRLPGPRRPRRGRTGNGHRELPRRRGERRQRGGRTARGVLKLGRRPR